MRFASHAAIGLAAVVVLGGISVAALHTQSVSAEAIQTPPASAGEIAGQVVDATTGMPLDGARVDAISPETGEQASATTGSSGRYAFVGLPAGAYRVVASKPGYAGRDFGAQRSLLLGTPIRLSDGETRRDISFRLATAGTISGRVLDGRGAPVAGAAIEAVRPMYQNGQLTLAMFGMADSDARGEFRLQNLSVGNYFVRASLSADESADDTTLARFPTYHPNTVRAADAETVRVDVRTEAPTIQITLQSTRGVQVEGRLSGDEGTTLLGGAITMTPYVEGDYVIGRARGVPVDPEGRFTFDNVPPGPYLILARALDSMTPRLQFATFSVEIDTESLTNLTMTLRPGGRLAGELVFASATTPPPTDFTGLTIRALGVDTVTAGTDAVGRVAPDGTFRVQGIMPGPRVIRVEGLPQPWMLEAVLYRGRDVADIPLEVAADQAITDLRIMLGTSLGSIAGTVRNEQGAIQTDRTVVVLPVNPTLRAPYARQVQLAYPDLDGSYVVAGLPPGRYFVAVIEELDRSELFVGGRLDGVLADAASITVTTGETLTLDLTVAQDAQPTGP